MLVSGPTRTRLQILEGSLSNKKAKFDAKLDDHFDSVRAVNGQPLNDKRNGAATLAAWERQNNALRNLDKSVKKTESAIDREKDKIAQVEAFKVPEFLQSFLHLGLIRQWRKHPRFFFVNGVEKARLVITVDGELAHKYLSEIPNKEQYAIFRNVFNSARKAAASQPGEHDGK